MEYVNMKKELNKIYLSYFHEKNNVPIRDKMRKEIKEKLFDRRWMGEIVDKTTREMIKNNKFLFKIKIFKREFSFKQYEKFCNI